MNPRVELVIDEFGRHRRQFRRLCQSLTERELRTTVPGSHWSVRDYVAHLCTIDGLIAPGFAASVGQSVALPDTPLTDPFDIDDWNEAAVRGREGRTVDELLTESDIHRENLLRAVAEFSDSHLDRIIAYGGDRKTLNLPQSHVRFGGLLWGIAIHEPTHTRDILRALPDRATEPWVSEWLASVNDSLVPDGVREQRV